MFVVNRIKRPVNIEFFLPNQPIVTLWSFEKITLESPSAHITADIYVELIYSTPFTTNLCSTYNGKNDSTFIYSIPSINNASKQFINMKIFLKRFKMLFFCYLLKTLIFFSVSSVSTVFREISLFICVMVEYSWFIEYICICIFILQ